MLVLSLVSAIAPACSKAAALELPSPLGNRVPPASNEPTPARARISLDGAWEASLDLGKTWHPCRVPAPIEDQLDWEFDGVAWLRRDLTPMRIEPGQRLFLRFEAAATRVKVYFENQLVGEHLGGWTPFECEITELARKSSSAPRWQIRVEVDELVGHNTQGFLPIIIPHFGGIWQSVSMVRTGDNRFLNDRILATTAGSQQAGRAARDLVIRWGVNSPRTLNGRRLALAYRQLDAPEFAPLASFDLAKCSTPDPAVPFAGAKDHFYEVTVPVELPDWSPEKPLCYQLNLKLLTANGEVEDEAIVPICNRSIAATSDSIQLNGQPLVVRGLLNWGYAPPSFAPTLDEARMRREIEIARERGFNLMKFCLWIPPQRYLELCDEYGMLAWVEYPTWHPQLDQKHLPELQAEFQEFFEYDRNHPCVLLRSLTCETGPSADINVIRDLYNRCKKAIPGAIVEDDSSWISWNRVTDFYDDHPYGNNHTWVNTLAGLKQYIAEHEPKPLVLGEAIAADSFQLPGRHSFSPRDPEAAIAPRDPGKQPQLISPHAPWAEASNAAWQEKISEMATRLQLVSRLERLPEDSRHYGLLMRKYQIETYRREMPRGGYVVSVIRDFPKAAMGLIDYSDSPKNPAADWTFQSDGMLLLTTQSDRRSFLAGEPANLDLQLTWSGNAPVPAGEFRLQLLSSASQPRQTLKTTAVGSVELGRAATVPVSFTPPNVAQPTRMVLQGDWRTEGGPSIRNSWPIWIFPAPQPLESPLVRVGSNTPLPAWNVSFRTARDWAEVEAEATVMTDQFSPELLEHLASGGRAVIVPNNTVNSLPTSQHWFLRGSPLGFEQPQLPWFATAPLSQPMGTTPAADNQSPAPDSIDLLNELQHFDLAGPVVPAIEHFENEILPLVLFWDNHDQPETRTHAGAFVIKVGKGRALVTTLNHGGPTNAAGNWLLHRWLSTLSQGQLPETLPDLKPRLARELTRQGMILHERNWKFHPDPSEEGIKAGWQNAQFDDSGWQEIRADRHWEGQGFKELDHWAWYRLKLRLPEDWRGPCFLNLTGADDYCDIYLNGTKVGSCGDMANKRTAFEERASFELTQHVQPGQEFVLAVAVYDWYGAGGLFKPMTLSTQPLDQAPPMLK